MGGATGISWVEARDVAKRPTITQDSLRNKGFLVPGLRNPAQDEYRKDEGGKKYQETQLKTNIQTMNCTDL